MREIFVTALVAVSLLTSLVTEGVKKLLDEAGIKYKPNILAAIISVVLSVVTVVLYVMYYGIPLTSQVTVSGVSLILLSFLCSTVGYDKVIQTLEQLSR